MNELLTIGEVARRSGVAASALRFYEEKGLIASDREGGAQRRFPRHVLRRIAFIVFAQRIGLSLDEIALELAKLPPNRAPLGATGNGCPPRGRRASTRALRSWSACAQD